MPDRPLREYPSPPSPPPKRHPEPFKKGDPVGRPEHVEAHRALRLAAEAERRRLANRIGEPPDPFVKPKPMTPFRRLVHGVKTVREFTRSR